MKKLSQKEWIAVTVAVFIVGFFFVFGQTLVSIFSNNDSINPINMAQGQSQLLVQDEEFGSGEIASVGSRVVVHYTGRFVDGRVFDSSVSRGEPFQFVLGSGQVIKGWDEGIVGMRVGGKRLLSVPPEYGYGYQDYGPIPGGSTLIFEVELLKVEN
ncbi:MAG: FK506-binding protein 2 [Parcubacteria bacterium C7867-006]|nr:MAG: FK506-binding protein 2 [Parcubacteria bacterium C7867-006]